MIDWRARRLASAGVDPVLTFRLARAPDFDVHALLDLLDRGCPLDLALRITDPYDLPGGAR